MDRPERPGPDASAKEIQEYRDDYEAWVEWKTAQRLKAISTDEQE